MSVKWSSEREREEMLQISYLLTQILRHYYQILDTHEPDISNLICIHPQDRELQELRKTIENLRKQGARMYLGWISHFPLLEFSSKQHNI